MLDTVEFAVRRAAVELCARLSHLKHLVCAVSTIALHTTSCVCAALLHCRGIRVLVMSDEKLRAQYSSLLDWRVQAAAIIGTMLCTCALGAWVQTSRIADEPSYCLGMVFVTVISFKLKQSCVDCASSRQSEGHARVRTVSFASKT
jgi:hypothetical protein